MKRVPYSINPKRNTPRHIVIKMAEVKHKERILKLQGKSSTLCTRELPIRLLVDLSAETLQVRREWNDIFKVIKGKNLQPRIFYLARVLFRFDQEIKSFTDHQKLKEFSTTKPVLQEMLKEL